MTVTRIDYADDAALRAYHAAWTDAERAFAPHGLLQPYEHHAAFLRNQPAFKRCASWLADDGLGEAWWYETPDNRHRLDSYLHGTPAALDELYATLRGVAEEHGRTTIGMESVRGSTSAEWAEARGWKMALSSEQNVCLLADTDPDALRRWRDEADPAYELLAFDGSCPDELLDDYVELVRTMNDAPRGDLAMEDIVFSADRVRAHNAAREAAGFELWTVLARERATGKLVAFTELLHSPYFPEVVDQEDTAVIPAHRGHRLGLRVKAANLLRLLEERPAAVCVQTWNAESNKPMIDVNRALGFRCNSVWLEWEATD